MAFRREKTIKGKEIRMERRKEEIRERRTKILIKKLASRVMKEI